MRVPQSSGKTLGHGKRWQYMFCHFKISRRFSASVWVPFSGKASGQLADIETLRTWTKQICLYSIFLVFSIAAELQSGNPGARADYWVQ